MEVLGEIEDPAGLLERRRRGPDSILLALPCLALGIHLVGGWVGCWMFLGQGQPVVPLWVIGSVGVAFGLIGLWLVVVGMEGWWRQRRIGPGTRPWRADPWRNGRVVYSHYREGLGSLFGAVGLLAFLAPFHWQAWSGDAGDDGQLAVWMLVLLFDILVVVLLFHAVQGCAQAIKHGASILHLAQVPFIPGQPFRFGLTGRHCPDVQATLRYVREQYVLPPPGEDGSLRLQASLLHQQIGHFHWSPEQRVLAMAFDWEGRDDWYNELVPHPDPGAEAYYWELLVEADLPGFDFHARFPLPVYRVDPDEVRVDPDWRSPPGG